MGELLGSIISIVFFGFVAIIAARAAIKRVGINKKYGWAAFLLLGAVLNILAYRGTQQYAIYAKKPQEFTGDSFIFGFFWAGLFLWLLSFIVSLFKKMFRKKVGE